MLFPTTAAANRCLAFINSHCESEKSGTKRVTTFVGVPGEAHDILGSLLTFSAVFFPASCFSTAKTFWQHTGEGVSSRRAEYCRHMYEKGLIVQEGSAEALGRQKRGPRRYRKTGSDDTHTSGSESQSHTPIGNDNTEAVDQTRHLEERFGRNLNMDMAKDAKQAIKRRIAGSLTSDTELDKATQMVDDHSRIRKVAGFTPEDVWLYPCGMNAIYSTHLRILAIHEKAPLESICFGFPYIDTLKVLEKIGPGCLFYGNGTSEDLDDLERRLESGERYSSLFCEFPSNPLLRTPDLQRIRALADKYDFVVAVDETIGNFLNVSILPLADVMFSSLTKIFSGDSNVMGGWSVNCTLLSDTRTNTFSAIFNPISKYYQQLKDAVPYDDCYWPEDAIVMERNSRDFVSRIDRINTNAETICDILASHPRIKNVYYPKVNPSRSFYDERRNAKGGYGGLLSATFYSTEDAAAFYDNLDTEKGPSLGTNFTLASPFVLLAHYSELEWAAQFGVDKNLVRFSVGLEDTEALRSVIQKALAAL